MEKLQELENNCYRLLIKKIKLSSTFNIIDFIAPYTMRKTSGIELFNKFKYYYDFFQKLNLTKKTKIFLPMLQNTDTIPLLLSLINADLFPILLHHSPAIGILDSVANNTGTNLIIMNLNILKKYNSKLKLNILKQIDKDFYLVEMEGYKNKKHYFPKNGDIGILTSGTTGIPKVVVHNICSIIKNAIAHSQAINLTSNDTIILSSPLNFSYSLVAGLLSSIYIESKLVIINNFISFEKAINKTNATLILCTPSFISTVTTINRSINKICIGGDVLHKSLALKILNEYSWVTLYSTYGLTEAGPRVATLKITQNMLSNYDNIPLGDFLPGIKFKLIKTSKPNVFELLLKTPYIMEGYLNDEKETNQVLKNKYLSTGDLFILNKRLFFYGRIKKIICRGGENISPILIEKNIIESGLVKDVYVKSIPHSLYGEVPIAYVIPKNNFSISKINKYLRKKIPNSYIPTKYKIVSSLEAYKK